MQSKVYFPGVHVEAFGQGYNEISEVRVGDRVNWLDQKTGQWNEGVLLSAAAKTVAVTAPYRPLYSRSRNVAIGVVRVRLECLRRRVVPSEALQEEMAVECRGFKVDGWCHPVGNAYKTMPNGVFYGRIDGETVTAPVASFRAAIADALVHLSSGRYGVDLLNRFELHNTRIEQLEVGHKDAFNSEMRRRIDLYQRCLKYRRAWPERMDASWPSEAQLESVLSLIAQRDEAAQGCLNRLMQDLPSDTRLVDSGPWSRLQDRWESEHYYVTEDAAGGATGWATCAVDFAAGAANVISAVLADEHGCDLVDADAQSYPRHGCIP